MSELNDLINDAEQRAAESHGAAMNSYGAGYDSGYLAGLKEAKRVLQAVAAHDSEASDG